MFERVNLKNYSIDFNENVFINIFIDTRGAFLNLKRLL